MTCSVVWGTTWIAIKYQLGTVDPMLSIAYRFGFAAAAMLVYCGVVRKTLRFGVRDHVIFAAVGCFMFCLNYLAVYIAEMRLPSGLVAVAMTSIIFFNVLNNRIFLGTKIIAGTLVGGVVGIAGLALIFYPEIQAVSMTGDTVRALGLSLLGALAASFGNTAAQVSHRRKIPVVQLQAYAMLYGGLLMVAMILVRRVPLRFDMSTGYVVSLAYLAVFGSVAAFLSYLTLLKRIGSDKAAYITLVTPLVALGRSTLFEGYTWTPTALLGTALIVAGNVIALKKK